MKRILLTVALSTAITAIATQAHANNYQVKSGDTLYTIAKENGTSVAQLKELNIIKNNKVLPGQKIKIASHDYYRVVEGDTIQSVAKQFKVSPFEIRFWNELSTSELRLGKKIIVSKKAYRKSQERIHSPRRIAPTLSPTTTKFVNDINAEVLNEEFTRSRGIQNAESEREFNNDAIDRSTMHIELSDSTNNTNSNNAEVNYFNNTIVDDAYDIEETIYAARDITLKDHAEDRASIESSVNHQLGEEPRKVSNHVGEIAHRIAAGKSYVYGANTNTAVDCSSFAQQVYAAMGISIPRTTYSQMAVGTRVSTPKPGDLVFFNNGSHVGVYIGNGQMVDALNPEVGVGQRAVSYIKGTITGYYRY
ncbi:LysM peptidoglycan-binding domain-containing protein [Macrococcus animalis]|uniref:LysM peptidoglycan-binding domain-containing protein n=1 Tax=Macrococcus animalis TaxID=3395467 RepID=UPI0039BDA44A